MLLTGSYRRTLDDKSRLAIPKQLRDALGFTEQTVLYLAPGTDGSLAIYTHEVFDGLGQRLAAASPAAQELRSFSRLFYAQAQMAEVDKQGRLRIPPELAALAKLTSEVVLLGVRDHMELWDAAAWSAYLGDNQPQYDRLAENALGPQSPTGSPKS
ncbi:MAG: division/cell wall cluster transcriptional repressor MraZ [Pirellulaceae bacterium]|nr:division/cell wall cluster transcriptional repressor MraZ [Pirellulaceae bacterium]